MEEQSLHTILKLSQNENPLGPSPRVLDAVNEAGDIIHRYPEPHSNSLKKVLADRLGLSSRNVLVSAGLVESLDIMIRNFTGDEGSMIIGEITFVAYKLLAEVFGVDTKYSRMPDFRMDIDDILKLYDENTKLIIIANPNNPTGTIISEMELIQLMESIAPETYVVVDEAYCEYVTRLEFPDSIALLKRYPNLIVMRTFSKIYGLAGLRVGYTIASETIIDRMQHFQAPFTVNHLAMISAKAALNDQEYVEMCCKLNSKYRIQLAQELTDLGIIVTPSQSNFLFLTFSCIEERDRVYKVLEKNRVLVRKMDLFGAKNSFRLTIGSEEDNARIISVLSTAFASDLLMRSDGGTTFK